MEDALVFLYFVLFGMLSIFPWFVFVIFNYFNGNIWEEIKATINRKLVKTILVNNDNTITTNYKKRSIDDGSILLKKGNKEDDQDVKMQPDSTPHVDSKSNRLVFIGTYNKKGNINLLDETTYSQTNQYTQMHASMSVELGRKLERLGIPQKINTWIFFILFLVLVACGAVVVVAALVYMNQITLMDALIPK